MPALRNVVRGRVMNRTEYRMCHRCWLRFNVRAKGSVLSSWSMFDWLCDCGPGDGPHLQDCRAWRDYCARCVRLILWEAGACKGDPLRQGYCVEHEVCRDRRDIQCHWVTFPEFGHGPNLRWPEPTTRDAAATNPRQEQDENARSWRGVMTGCCGETGCNRRTPIAFYKGPWSDEVFAVTKARVVHDHGNGRATFAAVQRHDVTAAMVQFIRCESEWVRAVLDEVDEVGEVGDPEVTP